MIHCLLFNMGSLSKNLSKSVWLLVGMVLQPNHVLKAMYEAKLVLLHSLLSF